MSSGYSIGCLSDPSRRSGLLSPPPPRFGIGTLQLDLAGRARDRRSDRDRPTLNVAFRGYDKPECEAMRGIGAERERHSYLLRAMARRAAGNGQRRLIAFNPRGFSTGSGFLTFRRAFSVLRVADVGRPVRKGENRFWAPSAAGIYAPQLASFASQGPWPTLDKLDRGHGQCPRRVGARPRPR